MLALCLGIASFWALSALFTAINLLVFRRLPAGDPPGAREAWPRVSIVIPARNEERAIGQTLDAALAQDYPSVEVIVVDDCSTDGTASQIAARASDPRLRSVAGKPPPEGWLGKPHALATGTAAARGDWLLLMDADVRLAPPTLRHAIGYAERHELDHLALFPYLERKGFWEEVLMPILAVTGFIYFPTFLANWRRMRRFALGGGAFNLVRTTAYTAIGGHQRLANSVVDDIRLALELKRAGFASELKLGDHVVTLRMYHGRRELVDGFTKNTHAVLQASLGPPWVAAALATFATLTLHFGPLVWIGWLAVSPAGAFSSAGLALALSLVLLLGARFAVQWRMGYPLWPALAHPLLVLVGLQIQIRSVAMAYGEGVVRWREREYRRETTTF